MKIAVLTNLFPPNVLGGAELVAHSLALSLTQDGHEVDIVTITDTDGETRQDGMRVFQVGSSPFYSPYWSKTKPSWRKPLWHAMDLFNPFMAKKVRDVIAGIKPDIVHAHNVVGFSTASWIAIRKLGIPIIFHLHDYHLVCPRATLMDDAFNQCAKNHVTCNARSFYHLGMLNKNVQGVISPSRFCVETVYERFVGGKPEVPYYVIPNGTFYAEVDRTPIDWFSRPFKILFIGGLFTHKGVRVLFDLITKLNAHPDEFEFHIAGKGPLEKDVVEFAQLHGNVRFHGFVSGKGKLDLFLDAHLFLFPSIWLENNPVTVLEALSLGIPVLGSEIGGVPELLAPISDRLLFKPGDVEHAWARILDLNADRPFLASLSRALLRDRSQYGMAQQKAQVLEVFEKTLREHRTDNGRSGALQQGRI